MKIFPLLENVFKFIGEVFSRKKSGKQPFTGEPVKSAWVEISHTIKELPFRQCFIRNEEMNNNLPLKESKPIIITEVTESRIKLSWLPNIPELFHPPTEDSLAKWGLMILDFPQSPKDPSPACFDYTEVMLIEGGDYNTLTLNYKPISGGNFRHWRNRRVALYNPFSGWEIRSTPLIEPSAELKWCQTYLAPAGMFRRNDGNYILLTNGESRKSCNEPPKQQVGAFISADPWRVPFQVLNHNQPVFQDATQFGESFQITSIVQSQESGYWMAYGNCRKGKQWSIIAVKFDEDFKDTRYFENLIFPAPHPTNKTGVYFPTVVQFQDHYRMMWVNRSGEDKTSWYLSEGIASNEVGPFDYRLVDSNPVFRPAKDNNGIFRSNHTHQPSYFKLNNNLFCLYDGTSRWKTSGNRGNRLFGMAHFDPAEKRWFEDTRNPIFINPLYGHKLWGSEWQWCADHLGGKQFLYETNLDRFLLFYSASCGSDKYKVAGARAKL